MSNNITVQDSCLFPVFSETALSTVRVVCQAKLAVTMWNLDYHVAL